MQFRLPLLLSFLIIFALGCGPDYQYEKSYSIDAGSWSYADSLEFAFEIEDTLQLYNLWLDVEHTVEYGYQNLYTRVHTRFPDGQQLIESLSLELADQVGRWYGDCNQRICSLRIPIQQGAFFNQAGTYQIVLEQYMRVDPVQGVQRIGFLVEKTGQAR